MDEDARMKRMPAKRAKARKRVFIREVEARIAGEARAVRLVTGKIE